MGVCCAGLVSSLWSCTLQSIAPGGGWMGWCVGCGWDGVWGGWEKVC